MQFLYICSINGHYGAEQTPIHLQAHRAPQAAQGHRGGFCAEPCAAGKRNEACLCRGAGRGVQLSGGVCGTQENPPSGRGP